MSGRIFINSSTTGAISAVATSAGALSSAAKKVFT